MDASRLITGGVVTAGLMAAAGVHILVSGTAEDAMPAVPASAMQSLLPMPTPSPSTDPGSPAPSPSPSVSVSASPSPDESPSATPSPTTARSASPSPTPSESEAVETPSPSLSKKKTDAKVQHLRVAKNSAKSLTIRWDPVEGATSYAIHANGRAVGHVTDASTVLMWDSLTLHVAVAAEIDGELGPAESLVVERRPAAAAGTNPQADPSASKPEGSPTSRAPQPGGQSSEPVPTEADGER